MKSQNWQDVRFIAGFRIDPAFIVSTDQVQEHALVQAQNRIQELEWQLETTQRQAQAAQQPRGGLLRQATP